FLLFYIFNRKHSSLKKELNVKTPYDAIEWWYKNKPEIFHKSPLEFKNNILKIYNHLNIFQEQRCER
ncbi:MAG: hypothetical protein ABIB46_03880, partial [bacterium]